MSSESVEMYLVTIALLGEEGLSGPVPLSRLADELSVQSVSANQMIRKMDDEGMVTYLPYKGVELTEQGSEIANHILRHRRLWEVFFVEQLGLSPGEAEDLACRMEHDTTLKVSERLASFLDDPTVSPSGKVIPTGQGEPLPNQSWRLSDLKVGQEGEVLAFQGDDITSSFLRNEGLEPGVRVMIEAVSTRGAVLVSVGQKRVSITKEIADKIRVEASEVITAYAV
jgi:DtxR family Mn-dependent transcriptional regulator